MYTMVVKAYVWCPDLMERDHLQDLRVDGKIILKRI
jgi:hypothetical protein